MSTSSEILHECLQTRLEPLPEEVIDLAAISVSSTQQPTQIQEPDNNFLERTESFQREGVELVNAIILDFEGQSPEVQAIVRLSIEAAANGHAGGQYKLGESYETSKLYRHAFYWFSLAAVQGYQDAQYKLGCLYQEYTGVLNDINNNAVNFPDVQKALEWHSQAAEQGHAGAQYKVGCFYRDWIDLKDKSFNLVKTKRMGYHWIRRAAEQGHSEAQYVLGYSYQYESPVRWMDADKEFSFPDMQKAFDWYSKAAVQNHPDALFALGSLYQYHSTFDAIITGSNGVNIIFPNLSKSGEFYAQALAKGHEGAGAALVSLQPKRNEESVLQTLRAIVVSRNEKVASLEAIIEAQDVKLAALEKEISKNTLNALICEETLKSNVKQLRVQLVVKERQLVAQDLHLAALAKQQAEKDFKEFMAQVALKSKVEQLQVELAGKDVELAAQNAQNVTLLQMRQLQEDRIRSLEAQVSQLLPLKEELRSPNDNAALVLNSVEARGVLSSPSKKNKSAGGDVESPTKRQRIRGEGISLGRETRSGGLFS